MKLYFVCISIFFIIFSVSSSFSQEDIITINSDLIKKHERPLVQFPHKMHEEKEIECSRCHHDYNKYGVSQSEDGQKCLECHKTDIKSNPVSLVKAFHLQCKGCHEKIQKTEKIKTPVMCGQCHEKNKGKE